MKLRLTLVALSFVLSVFMPADQVTNDQPGTWIPILSNENFPAGLGVNIHFTNPAAGELEMISGAGFTWIRMDFKWDATEREKGRYDFGAYDRLVTTLEQHNLHALFILDYGNLLYDDGAPPRTVEARQAFARWALAAAKHFAGRGIIWETYNEPNIRIFWPPRPSVDEYIELALAVAHAFRSEVPNEKLVGPATSGIDFPFLESCFKAGLLDYWSAVSVHPYRQSDPETAASDYRHLRNLIERYNRRAIPIISSEWGYSSVWRGMNEEKQGRVFARELLTNMANGIPVSIWYDWRDDGADATEPEHHFGLIQNSTRQPKSAYVAAQTLTSAIVGYRFEKRFAVGSGDDYVLAFRKGTDVRLVAWTTLTVTRSVTLPVDGSWSMIDWTGQSRMVSAGAVGLPIQLSNSPIYLRRN